MPPPGMAYGGVHKTALNRPVTAVPASLAARPLGWAFDAHQVVLLHAWAGAGKTSTALEFARWYALTGAADGVLFTSFERHLTLARLLDQAGTGSGPRWKALGCSGPR
jgi:hypothetical protein